MSRIDQPATKNERPTDKELQVAIQKAKDPPHNLGSSQIKHTDHGASIVRHYLPSKFHSLPLDEVRLVCEKLSKGRKEPGKRKRTDEQRAAGTLRSLLKAFPPQNNHSEAYHRLHDSDAYRSLRDKLKRLYDYRCQLCCRHFLGHSLEGHILDYDNWDQPGMMLILCVECHPIADALRRRGKLIDIGKKITPMLFD